MGLTRFVFAALLVVIAALNSHAASITVTTTADEVNGNTTSIANLIATPGGAGISLREAIIAANNTPGADTITLPAGTYTLTIANTGGVNEDACLRGDLDVADSLTITGAGAASTIIQAGTTAANGIDKVLAINPICDHAVNFAMSGVTIRFGRNTQPNGAADFSFTGGGIDWCGHGGGSLTLTDCVISDNTNVNGYGGGLNTDEVAPSSGVVTITNTRFSNNTSKNSGGGINIYGDNVRVTITGSVITNNHTLGTGGVFAGGGGIEIRITNQNDGDGAPTPFVTIGNSIVSGNSGVGAGGGIDVASTGNQDITITNTAITGNSLIVVAGGVSNTTGGGIGHNNNAARTTLLSNVLIANNQSEGSATSLGGGISHGGGNMTIRNSTISGNSARDGGGGIYVTTDPLPLTLINTTISNNRADSDNTGSGIGGGILKLAGTSTVNLQNTICDGNFRGTGSTADEINGAMTANSSLIGNTTGATITGANNQLNVSGRLAPLANNGGQTVGLAGFTAVLQTHALLAGSPALDNGSNALVPAALTTDQRGTGFVRIADAADANTTDTVDIGAFEAHPAVEDIANQVMNEDGSLAFTFNVGDADLGFTSITASSGNTTLLPNYPANLAVSGSGSSRTLTINPATNQFGSATITVTVNATVNGTSQSMTDTFALTVTEVNGSPVGVSDTLSDVLANSGTRTIPFTTFLANDSKGPANESSQVLTIISVGSAFGGAVSIVGTNVLFTPTSNYFGPASFVYTLQDNGTTAGANDFKTSTATVSFNILAVPPTVTCPPNITTNTAPGGCQQSVAFTGTIVSGVPAPTLTYTLGTTVITSPYVFSRGTNIVTVTASNGAPPNATCSFSVTVLPGPAPQLTFALSGTNLVLSWPSGSSCYTLQFTPALLSPPSSGLWTAYPGPFVTTGGDVYVTNGISTTNRFFRLAF